jgi:hypothetical protein
MLITFKHVSQMTPKVYMENLLDANLSLNMLHTKAREYQLLQPNIQILTINP